MKLLVESAIDGNRPVTSSTPQFICGIHLSNNLGSDFKSLIWATIWCKIIHEKDFKDAGRRENEDALRV